MRSGLINRYISLPLTKLIKSPSSLIIYASTFIEFLLGCPIIAAKI